ncbi:MAG TPA: Hsp20/alpha crystallin family protein [Tepidisphaeraceae bacterium]|jgi:HSP20 family protein|nr:Hsp20/alpha crystallin family protein [Tepidisphaeraceae bacterium]
MVAIHCAEKPFKSPQTSPSKMLEQLQSKGYYSFFPNENWTPNVNLYETDAAYLVCVDLAGVEKDKIEIEVVDGRLRLRGNRAVPMCTETTETRHTRIRMHLMEIDHGSFARDVELPEDVQREHITARHQDGMLWIELPKKL